MILTLDTSTKKISLSLLTSTGEKVDQMEWKTDRKLTNELLPHLKEIIHKNNYAPQDITEFFCHIGPGSYTGLRIGLSVANSFAFALNIPLKGLSFFQILALHFLKEEKPYNFPSEGTLWPLYIHQNYPPITIPYLFSFDKNKLALAQTPKTTISVWEKVASKILKKEDSFIILPQASKKLLPQNLNPDNVFFIKKNYHFSKICQNLIFQALRADQTKSLITPLYFHQAFTTQRKKKLPVINKVQRLNYHKIKNNT